MRKRAALAAIFFAAAAALLAAEKPSLVVVISVDQMRNDYLDRFRPWFGPDGWIYWTKGAFKKMNIERPGRPPINDRAASASRRHSAT